MKGIILAGGKGSRLYPMTRPVCKPLLPVYDKPLIYYSVSILIEAGIREILVIVPPGEEHVFQALLGDGSQWGVSIAYAVQLVPRGIADAMLVGAEFIGQDSVCLVLGDNIFYQEGFAAVLKQAVAHNNGATVFGYYVQDPERFGIVEFDKDGKVLSVEEKPQHPKSNYAIPGLYFYDNQVIDIARKLTPSARGELEITDVNLEYLRREQLQVVRLERDFLWLDAGTADSVLEAAERVRDIQRDTGHYVGCIEKCAREAGWISKEQVHQLGKELEKTRYGQYLLSL